MSWNSICKNSVNNLFNRVFIGCNGNELNSLNHTFAAMFKKTIVLLLLLTGMMTSWAQAQNTVNDAEASALLLKVSDKYKACKNISSDFKLIIQRPKLKPNEDDKKYTDTLKGSITLQQAKFNIHLKGQQIVCDGKNIWTYTPSDKEVQVNIFEESDDMFSPSKIFSLYKEGYVYQIKEKIKTGGKAFTVIEMSPSGKKLSYFKIDVTIDDNTLQIVESKIYEKNGVRYIYKLGKQQTNTQLIEDSFNFDSKKHPGVKVVDLR